MNEEIEFALLQRNRRIARDCEQSLLTTIIYSSTGKAVVKKQSQTYSERFLELLEEHGIIVTRPDQTDDGNWLFTLPDSEGVDDDY